MRRFLVAVGCLAAPGLALAQGAPFCVVSGLGQQCTHYSLDSCQSAARTLDGMCVANTQGQQLPQFQQVRPISQQSPQSTSSASSYWQSLADSQERAQRARQQQEQHAAQLRLLEAQAAQARASTATYGGAPVVRYLCSTQERGMHVTETPEIGCTVVEISR